MKLAEILEKYYNLYSSLTDNADVDRKATIFCFCYAQITFNIKTTSFNQFIKDKFNSRIFDESDESKKIGSLLNHPMRDYYDNSEYILTSIILI